jgi:hypothetical protein
VVPHVEQVGRAGGQNGRVGRGAEVTLEFHHG